MSYFTPVLPDESAETVRGTLLDIENVKTWKSPIHEIPTVFVLRAGNENINDMSTSDWQNQPFSINSKISQSRGQSAEEQFVKVCNAKGWTKIKDEKALEHDYGSHVDAMIKIRDNEEMWVDVKCCRCLRKGWKEQSEYFFVELNNTGWLFGSKATVIAQQIGQHAFLLFDRNMLCEYTVQTVKTDLPVVPYTEQSFERVYLRISERGSFTITHALSVLSTKKAYEYAGCGFLTM